MAVLTPLTAHRAGIITSAQVTNNRQLSNNTAPPRGRVKSRNFANSNQADRQLRFDRWQGIGPYRGPNRQYRAHITNGSGPLVSSAWDNEPFLWGCIMPFWERRDDIDHIFRIHVSGHVTAEARSNENTGEDDISEGKISPVLYFGTAAVDDTTNNNLQSSSRRTMEEMTTEFTPYAQSTKSNAQHHGKTTSFDFRENFLQTGEEDHDSFHRMCFVLAAYEGGTRFQENTNTSANRFEHTNQFRIRGVEITFNVWNFDEPVEYHDPGI